jgi:hypothetical protein
LIHWSSQSYSCMRNWLRCPVCPFSPSSHPLLN